MISISMNNCILSSSFDLKYIVTEFSFYILFSEDDKFLHKYKAFLYWLV